MLSAAALRAVVSGLDFAQDKVNGTVREKNTYVPHTHTHHPYLTRLVNHLSQGQGNGRTPLSSVCPPSLPLHPFISSTIPLLSFYPRATVFFHQYYPCIFNYTILRLLLCLAVCHCSLFSLSPFPTFPPT